MKIINRLCILTFILFYSLFASANLDSSNSEFSSNFSTEDEPIAFNDEPSLQGGQSQDQLENELRQEGEALDDDDMLQAECSSEFSHDPFSLINCL